MGEASVVMFAKRLWVSGEGAVVRVMGMEPPSVNAADWELELIAVVSS